MAKPEKREGNNVFAPFDLRIRSLVVWMILHRVFVFFAGANDLLVYVSCIFFIIVLVCKVFVRFIFRRPLKPLEFRELSLDDWFGLSVVGVGLGVVLYIVLALFLSFMPIELVIGLAMNFSATVAYYYQNCRRQSVHLLSRTCRVVQTECRKLVGSWSEGLKQGTETK